jgi:hypothetical protein
LNNLEVELEVELKVKLQVYINSNQNPTQLECKNLSSSYSQNQKWLKSKYRNSYPKHPQHHCRAVYPAQSNRTQSSPTQSMAIVTKENPG